jgi:hypothetical protein
VAYQLSVEAVDGGVLVLELVLQCLPLHRRMPRVVLEVLQQALLRQQHIMSKLNFSFWVSPSRQHTQWPGLRVLTCAFRASARADSSASCSRLVSEDTTREFTHHACSLLRCRYWDESLLFGLSMTAGQCRLQPVTHLPDPCPPMGPFAGWGLPAANPPVSTSR